MLRRYRQSRPAKIAASGFILTLLCANVWIIDGLLGVPATWWTVGGTLVGMLTALLGGAGLLFIGLFPRLIGRQASEEGGDDLCNKLK